MSDAGVATEQWLMQHEPELRADLIIHGQHSRDDSATVDFISRVNPQAVILPQPRFGEDEEQLNRRTAELEELGISVFRQDQCGAITIEVRDQELSLRGFLNGQTFRNRK
jgi:beta-lactamase superfamily II metal-dependent hydrolase